MANVCEVDKEFEGTKCSVDKRIILVWLFPVALMILGSWVILAFLYYNFSIKLFGLDLISEILMAFLLALLIIGIPSFIWFYLRYKAMSHIIARNEIVINEGVINKKRTVIPFVQIQDIYVRKPLLYRLVGISRIEIQTAGDVPERGTPEGILPGISNAEEVVKDLLERVRQIRKFPETVKTEDHELLSNILNELKALRESQTQAAEPKAKEEAKRKYIEEGESLKQEIFNILSEMEKERLEGALPPKKKPKIPEEK